MLCAKAVLDISSRLKRSERAVCHHTAKYSVNKYGGSMLAELEQCNYGSHPKANERIGIRFLRAYI